MHLAHAQAVLSNSELRLATGERLSASSNTGQDLAAGHTMLASNLLDKLHQIAIEAVNLLLGNKAEHIHLAVLAVVQLPAVASQGDGSNGAASGGNGTSASESTDPDHDFVLGVTASFGGGEEVVGDVCDEVVAGVGPFPD